LPRLTVDGRKPRPGSLRRSASGDSESLLQRGDQLRVLLPSRVTEGGGEIVQKAREDDPGSCGFPQGRALRARQFRSGLEQGGLEMHASSVEAIDDQRMTVLEDPGEEMT